MSFSVVISCLLLLRLACNYFKLLSLSCQPFLYFEAWAKNCSALSKGITWKTWILNSSWDVCSLWMADASSFHRNRTPRPTLETCVPRSCVTSTYQSGMGTVPETRTESVKGAKMLRESDVTPTYFSASYFYNNCFRKLEWLAQWKHSKFKKWESVWKY